MSTLSTRPLRFLVSGGAATAVHFTGMGLLMALHADAPLATAVGALLGAAVNYGLQYHWTFVSRRAHRDTISVFLLVTAANWLLNLTLFTVLYQLAALPAPFAQSATTGALTLLNYRLYGKVVFT
ncbi:GtrA family protein [Microbulbifer rhizosphaerae]|uniref:Putative flippase GtrA n=1 Tax=Microbulbifer rhizosphaerae TaxID=1562603 RepID=A0A7W4WDY9_9GAMM|nr:GtrA family protein [Microbulbifer rhizosphaerae]MBB3062461.1 putative flippase GtrA [Microbulbifer rhizosphaerae]